MKKTYKKLIVTLVFTFALAILSKAQCLSSSQYGNAVVTSSTPGTLVNASTCNYGGEYAEITFNVTGVFSFSTDVPTDYITITDDLNNPIAFGVTPLNSVTIPSVGLYYFHISTSGPPLCGIDASCRVSDVYVPLLPCSGLPSAGTVPVSFSICPNTSALINVTGATLGSGIIYQWEEAPTAGGPWTNVTSGSGFNSINFVTSPLSTQTYYRFVVTCVTSALSSTSTVFSVNPNNPVSLCYCNTGLGGGGCFGDFITDVIIPSTPFNNTSVCNTNAFGDAYSLFNPGAGTTATLTAGVSYPISINTTADNIISVWIDYDQNGTYDASEHTQVCFTSVSGIANTAVISIPATALTGQTGLRVRSRAAGNQNGPNDACSGFGSGETEDYVITINPAVPCSGVPGSNSVVATSTLICTGSTSNLNLLNTYTVGGLTYQWASAASSVGPYSSISGATLTTYATPLLSSTTWYRCVITCTSGPASTTATPVGITVVTTVTNTVPYFESFESIINDNDLPNCSWSASDLVNICQTYTAATGSFNRTPNTGSKYASFQFFTNPTGDYFYTNGIQLNAGTTYSASAFYITDGNNGWSDFSILYGTSQSPTGLVPIASLTSGLTNTTYSALGNAFTVPTSGIYYIAVKCIGNFNPTFLTWDDLSIIALPPCTGAPAANTVVATSTVVCSGGSINLSLANTYTAGALTYQWSSAPTSGGPYTAISGATLSSYALTSLSSTTWFRCVITCPSGPASTTATPLQISALGAPIYASVPFLENFDNTWQDRCDTRNVPIAANWDSNPTTGDNSWRRQDDGASANWTTPFFNVTPLAGSGAANFHSFDTYAATGNLDLYVNLGGTSSYDLSFYHINSDGDDSLQVLLSTDGGASFTPKITYLSGSYPPFDSNWNKKTINLGVVNSTSCVVRFLGTSDYGTSDIGIDSLEIKVLPPCTGVPASNTVVATSICTGGFATLSLATTYTSSSGLTYQWASATSSVGPYTVISGATLNTYSLSSLSSTTWFRCVITCPSGPASTTATPVQISALGAPVYASVPFLENFDNTWQDRCDTRNVPVAANWDSNPTTGDNSWRRQDDGASANWLTPFFNVTPLTGAGAANFHTFDTYAATGNLDLYVNLGGSSSYDLSFYHINSDGDDSLQVLLSTDGGASFTPKITYLSGWYPPFDPNWNKKTINLGVVNSTSCVVRFLGTSDYGFSDIGIDSLQIKVLPPCTGVPAANTVVATFTAVCSGGTTTLSLATAYSSSGLTYQWASATSSVGSYAAISGATLSTYSPASLSSTTWFRCVITCASGPASTTATPVQIGILGAPVYASVPFLENFDNTWQDRCDLRNVPVAANWDSNPTTGYNSWRRQDDGASANWVSTFGLVTPFDGAGSANFHSYDASNGTSGNLDLYVNLAGVSTSYDLSFYHINTDGGDSLQVLLSVDGGVSFTPKVTYLSGFYSPIDNNWNKKTISLGVVNSTSCVVRLLATSDYGVSDIGIDSLEIKVGGCTGPQPTTVWTGGAGTTDWFDNNNWSNCAPGPITDATIPLGGIVLISSSNADVKNLYIASGATLQIASTETIKLRGDWVNDGTFIASNGLVNFAGSSGIQNIFGISNTLFYDLTLNNSNHLNLAGNGATVKGTFFPNIGAFFTNNLLTLYADATGTGRIGPLSFSSDVIGGVNVQQYANGGSTGWALLGSPVELGITMNDWSDNFAITCPACTFSSTGGVPFTSVYSYDETVTAPTYSDALKYVPINAPTDPITNGLGYWVYLGNGYPNTTGIMFDTQGPVAKSDCMTCTPGTTVTIPISKTTNGGPGNDGWNLISNPLPSPISFSGLLNGNPDINPILYAYNADLSGGTGAMATYALGTGISVPAIGSGGIGDAIPMCQGFYVEAINNTSLFAPESIKIASNQALLRSANSSLPLLRLYMNESAGNQHDEIGVCFVNGATGGFDALYDARKFISDASYPMLAALSGTNQLNLSSLASIQTNPNQSVPLLATSPITGVFTFSLSQENFPSGICVELVDNLTNTTTNILTTPYTCTLYDTTTISRFTLNFKTVPMAGVTNVTQPSCVQPNGGSIVASGSVGAPWDYVWKNSSNVIVKTSLNVNGSDSIVSLNGGSYFVSVNSVGTCNTFTQGVFVNSVALPISQFTTSSDTVYLASGAMVNFTNASSNATNYYWNFGDGNTSSAPNPINVYSNAGVYNVKLQATSSTFCNDSSSQAIVVLSAPLGINSINLNNTVLLQNKNFNDYSVNIKLSEIDNVTLMLTDINGKLLLTKTQKNVLENELPVSLRDVDAGVYLLSVRFENKKESKVFKLIKY